MIGSDQENVYIKIWTSSYDVASGEVVLCRRLMFCEWASELLIHEVKINKTSFRGKGA